MEDPNDVSLSRVERLVALAPGECISEAQLIPASEINADRVYDALAALRGRFKKATQIAQKKSGYRYHTHSGTFHTQGFGLVASIVVEREA